MEMKEMLKSKIVKQSYANDTISNITKEEAEKIIKDNKIKKTIALNLKEGDILVAHYIGNSIVKIKKVDIIVTKISKNNRYVVINGDYTLHMYCDVYILDYSQQLKTISVTETAKELKLSRNRVYQLIHAGVIDIHNGKPTVDSVNKYKEYRRPAGRPEGTFKKHS